MADSMHANNVNVTTQSTFINTAVKTANVVWTEDKETQLIRFKTGYENGPIMTFDQVADAMCRVFPNQHFNGEKCRKRFDRLKLNLDPRIPMEYDIRTITTTPKKEVKKSSSIKIDVVLCEHKFRHAIGYKVLFCVKCGYIVHFEASS